MLLERDVPPWYFVSKVLDDGFLLLNLLVCRRLWLFQGFQGLELDLCVMFSGLEACHCGLDTTSGFFESRSRFYTLVTRFCIVLYSLFQLLDLRSDFTISRL